LANRQVAACIAERLVRPRFRLTHLTGRWQLKAAFSFGILAQEIPVLTPKPKSPKSRPQTR
jgi:hypothetical protein